MKRKPIILTRRIILPEVHRIISKLERLVYSVHEMKHWHLIKRVQNLKLIKKSK